MILILYTKNETEISEERWQQLLQKLPEPLHPSISRFYRWQDRQASLFGKLLLLEGLQQYGFSPKLVQELRYSEYERPFLPISLDFNISHSGEYVVCAFCEKHRIGIDIEQLKPVELRYFHSVLTPEERKWIATPPETLPERFFQIWTKKEAVIKAAGKGIAYSQPLNTVDGLALEVKLGLYWWHTKEIPLARGYSCHLASREEIGSISIEERTLFGQD